MDYFYKGSAIKKNAPVSWIAKADTLAANTNLVCVENVDNKKNSVLSVTAYFSAFTSLTVAHGYQMNYGNWCVVDGTNITTYYGTSATQMSQVAHGLTISEFLTVIIKQKTTQNAEITIMTAGGQFTTATVPHWHGSNGDVRMFGAQAMTDAELSYGLSDTRNDVFLFVDSYGTEGDAARVSRQIQNLGYDGFLALGHGGGNSAQTYLQFAKLIELAQPKVAVWMIGMNDPDSSSAINASWKSYAEQFAAACEARGIVPVFTTIPNVPNYQHTYKNAWIKESGYRYVDWAKAVGAEEAGSSWYTGMLSSDNVHPSELGAKALAMRTILDVPEITPKVEGGGAGGVTSVNGQTGAVVIPLAKPGNTHINVFNPEDANVEQGYLTAQGKVNYNADYWTTGYIPVSKDDVVRVFFSGANKNHAYAAEFTTAEQSGFVSRTANGSYASYTVQNDGYVRLSIKTSAVAWADRSTVMVTINDTDSTYIAYGDMGANDGLMSAADKKKLDGLGASAGKKVFDKFLFIAYSSFGSRAPNSVPHFKYCAQRDYDWLKADVQPTSDGGLVCCHDSGFTLDGNGRITTYNASSATEIYTMTLAQATALVYASYPTVHVASIDDFLAVCKRYGKTPHITIRDAHMDVVVPALMAALDKFALRSVAVINSSTRASLDAVRAADKNITMSLFVNPFGSSMAAGYNYCLADGNTMLGYFYTQSSHTWSEFIADSTVAGYITNCIQNGIVMWAGIESDASHVDDLISMGFSGVHTMQDRSTPTPTKTSDLTNDSGFLTLTDLPIYNGGVS